MSAETGKKNTIEKIATIEPIELTDQTDQSLLATQPSSASFEMEDAYLLSETIRKLRHEKNVLQNEVRELRDRLLKTTSALKAERQEWSSRLEQVSTREESYVEKYNELYQYSQQLINEAEKHKKSLELELDKAKRQIVEKSSYDVILTEIQVREADLMKNMQSLRDQMDKLNLQLGQAKKEEARAKFETAKVDSKLKIVLESHFSAQLQLSKARDMLMTSIRILNGLQKSAKDLFGKNIGANGSSASMLSNKAAAILIEQWNVEVENLRKLDIVISQISELHKKSQLE